MTVNSTWTSAVAGGTLDLAAGTIVTETHMDAFASNFNHLGGSVGYIGASGSRGAGQSVANATATLITLPTEEFDSDSMFTPSGSAITIPSGRDGRYLITGVAEFAANATGLRRLEVFAVSAVRAASTSPATSAESLFLSVCFVMPLTASQTVELRAYQTSGGALNITAAYLTVIKL